jgi:hypothetical protein
MATSRFFRAVEARRREDVGDAINRGISSGEQVGKLLSGLAGAIKDAPNF